MVNPQNPTQRLTFADDPVEDGLKLRDADLHVLWGEDGVFSGSPMPPTTGVTATASVTATAGPGSPLTAPASCLKSCLKLSSIWLSESTF